MLVLATSAQSSASSYPDRPSVHPVVALAPHILVGACITSTLVWLAWVHVRAGRRRRRGVSAGRVQDAQDREPLLGAQDEATDPTEPNGASEGQAPTGWELVLEALKVLVAVALVGLSSAKMLASEAGRSLRWSRVLEGGIIALSGYLTLTSAAEVLDYRVKEIVRAQQVVLSVTLTALTLIANVLPFAFIAHPPLSSVWRIGFAQATLASALCILLLLTPPRFVPRIPNARPNPAQTASPLSNLLFSFLESRMLRFYIASSGTFRRVFHLDTGVPDFKSFVPPLPDILHSSYVLERFRWLGDEPKGDFDDDKHDEPKHKPTMGTARHFAWQHKREVAIILAFATGWIAWIFVSPLSMNLLLRYVQQSESPPFGLSPYLFVVLIFVAPIASSVCFQSALYRLAQLGLRLRALLGHAVYAKLLRVKAGGGGKKSEGDGEAESEPRENGKNGQANGNSGAKGKKKGGSAGGGNEAIGRVNNLVGTDIDTITGSLPSTLQLFGCIPKLVVSIVFLYFLLGWSTFVALGAIVAFAPVSRVVAGKYGIVQGDILKATDRRITLVQELINSIRTLKMFGWEKPSTDRIFDARDTELERIKKRAKVYAGMMFLSTGIPAVVTLSTFGTYVFLQKQTLTASTAFTAMSLFGLLREAVISATFLLSAFMRAGVSLERIRDFLDNTEELDDEPRRFYRAAEQKSGSKDKPDAAIVVAAKSKFRFSRYNSSAFTLHLSNDQAQKGANSDTKSDLVFPRGKTTLVAGDVGSGKSALLLALLGELHVSSGGVEIRTEGGEKSKMSYAAQSPWLQDTSVRNNILFGEEYDEERYNETVFACALEDDLEALPEGDETRVGEKGLSMSGQIVLLDDVLSALDSNMVSHVVENCLNGPLLEGRTVVLVTHFVKLCMQRLTTCEQVIKLHDGKVVSVGPPSGSLTPGGSRMSRSPSSDSVRSSRSGSSRMHDAHIKHGSGVERDRGDSSGDGTEISWNVYRKYGRAMGSWKFWAPYAAINIVAHVFMLAQGWFIGRWVNAPDRDSHAGRYFGLYATIQLVASVSLTAMYLYLIWGGIRASRILHTRLTARIFAAPFRFWDRTPTSNAINRFSKDTEVLDTEQVENLQPVLDYAPQVLFVAVIISVVLPIFLLPAAVISGVFFCIGRLYIRNALAARKEVAAARSPLFSTLGDSTSGVTTIRAFGREKHFAERYKAQTDNYNKMQLYEEGLDRWLEERSDMVGATVSFIVGLLCLSSGLSSGVTGFLISTGLEFTSRILYVVRAVNKNELSLNSVQRIIQYSTEIETEEPHSDKLEPPAHWPDAGTIQFEHYSAKYAEDSEDVLHDLSLDIKPGEKIGIVGPSGCGKSTLSLALLRFILKSGGSIKIDGRKLSETNLDAIRSRLTLVPQDPTLFSGTLRSNLDPTGEHDDATLWNALKRSGFAKVGSNGDEDAHGLSLDTAVSSGGSNFSQGQRQLVGLARALVRSSKVVIMDEATASLDNESDELVQRVVREEFDGCTTITVAHRLESVIDFDRILVLRAGRIVEFDAPRALLDKPAGEGVFRDMVEATGAFKELYERAKGKAR
ncbi:hypothetical protein Rhopal_007133-T1 [Rhodotorula paludigena]|uniref:Uncharacterized protein n=1 Tax=Rhodotorula paludigena TaxID=86838 RepID=A0AAV5GY23_9BASI|nr:hypothetical protein Rhopal_007133-T1 [Rhodotorula paludigena]